MRLKNKALWLICGAGLMASAVSVADMSPRASTDQLIIRFKDDGLRRIQTVRHNELLPDIRLPDGRPLTFLRRYNGNGVVVRLPENVSLDTAQAIAASLEADPAVAAAQADKRMYPALLPDDTFFLPGTDPFPLGQWHLFEDTAGIRMPTGWDLQTGSPAVVIAVLDTGIIDHRDLDPARLLPGYDFFSDTLHDNDGEPGRDSDPTDPGDWVLQDECAPGVPSEDQRSSWHGLAVTGVMAATAENTRDITGIDFAARILPIRVLGKCGGSLSDVAAAIRWAAGLSVPGVAMTNPTPAQIINLSLSGDGLCSAEEQDAIDAAVAAGAVVVAAAGNEATDVAFISPANCNNVITVGAIARDGTIASYVNSGEEVDLSAPGGDDPQSPSPANPANGILTLFNLGLTGADPNGDALAEIQGTSFTAAQVSALAALMLAEDATLTPAQIEDILRVTTRAFPDSSCNPGICGTGVLDATAALAGAVDPASVLGATVDVGGGGGGGGCALARSRNAAPDPLLLVLLVVAGIGTRWQRRRRAPG